MTTNKKGERRDFLTVTPSKLTPERAVVNSSSHLGSLYLQKKHTFIRTVTSQLPRGPLAACSEKLTHKSAANDSNKQADLSILSGKKSYHGIVWLPSTHGSDYTQVLDLVTIKIIKLLFMNKFCCDPLILTGHTF